MSQDRLARVTAGTAAEVCRHFELGDTARELLDDSLSPRQYLDRLIEKKAHADAVRFLAYALPKREAVWWACLCLGEIAGPQPPDRTPATLQAAVRWVLSPTEDHRREAMAPANADDFATPAGFVAQAVFWSGGSMNPPDLPEIPPGEHLTARTIGGGLLLAACQGDPARIPVNYQRFLALGIGVANGQYSWPAT